MTLVPTEALVRPVEGHDDLFAFRFDFVPEAKALDEQVVTEDENGDLIIEGYAAVFEGQDRQGENFADGSFDKGIKAFLEGQAGLCYHHKHDKLLGKVLDLRNEEGKGLKMKARVDGAIRTHPELKTYYEQIKNGSLNALSVGGFFKRGMVNGLRKIIETDFTEISVTPVPVHSGTNFAVVAGKALEDFTPESEVSAEDPMNDLMDLITRFDGIFSKVGEKALPESHDESAASVVSDLLHHVQQARAVATNSQNDYREVTHAATKKAASAIETDLAKHEATLHTLAAEVGPLPRRFDY